MGFVSGPYFFKSENGLNMNKKELESQLSACINRIDRLENRVLAMGRALGYIQNEMDDDDFDNSETKNGEWPDLTQNQVNEIKERLKILIAGSTSTGFEICRKSIAWALSEIDIPTSELDL